MKVALYARSSTKKQDLSLQKETLKEFSKRRGHEIVKEYYDEGYSGARKDRPGHLQLMKDAETHSFEAVVVYKLDRFGRSTVDLLLSIEKLKSLGIGFISVTNDIDTNSSAGKFILHVFAALAEMEKDLFAERRNDGLDYARKHGTRSGKPMHRPRIEINEKQLRDLRSKKISYSACARYFGVSFDTIKSRCREFGLLDA